MSLVIAIMAVLDEEDLIEGAITRLQNSGCSSIHVFDGAWKNFPREGFASMDRTEEIVRSHSGDAVPTVWHAAERRWEAQEEKRTFMFQNAGATVWDYLMVVDADDYCNGRIDEHLDQQAYCVRTKCIGPNDMPGIRGIWPHGDYSLLPIPAVRVFRYQPDLACLWPGGYFQNGALVDVYEPDKTVKGGFRSKLPVIESVIFDHVPNDRTEQRKQQKFAYYKAEHPERKARQQEWIRARRR